MSTHQQKKDNVQVAIAELFNDTSVEPEETAAALDEIIELAADFINALPN